MTTWGDSVHSLVQQLINAKYLCKDMEDMSFKMSYIEDCFRYKTVMSDDMHGLSKGGKSPLNPPSRDKCQHVKIDAK